jgi:hypothetical protein
MTQGEASDGTVSPAAAGVWHRVPLGDTTWSAWRDVCLRSAGFPADVVLAICDEELACSADEGTAGEEPAYGVVYPRCRQAAVPRHRRHLCRSRLPGGGHLAEPRAGAAVAGRGRGRGRGRGAAVRGPRPGAGDRELPAAVLPEERHDRRLRVSRLGVCGRQYGWPGSDAGGAADRPQDDLFRGLGDR